jgi:hypothetical protein
MACALPTKLAAQRGCQEPNVRPTISLIRGVSVIQLLLSCASR